MYTAGVWNVKEGMEADFARGWQASVDRMSPNLPGVVFRLLRDTENPLRFVSMAGPWRTREQWDEIRVSDGFQQSMQAMSAMLDSFEISSFELAAEVS